MGMGTKGISMLSNDYIIKRIPYKLAMDIVIKHHYLHRKCPCSFAFGLFDKNNEIKGVVVLGLVALLHY